MTERGFTLIELIVVLAIASLLLVFIIPFGGRHAEQAALGRAVDEMASALRMTRSRAIHDDRPEALVVDVGQAQYRGAGAAAGGFPAGTHLTLMTTEEEKENAALGSIRFFPDGSSTGGGITVQNGGLRYEVLVDWLTGAVSVAPSRS